MHREDVQFDGRRYALRDFLFKLLDAGLKLVKALVLPLAVQTRSGMGDVIGLTWFVGHHRSLTKL